MPPPRPKVPSLAQDLKRKLAIAKRQPKTKRPNKHTDRVAWNNHFECDIEMIYGGFSYDDPPLLQEGRFDLGNITELNLRIAEHTKDLMCEEGLLIALALEKLSYGNFQMEWKNLDLAKKKDLALEGLYRGACLCPRDNSRISCPELTIKSLVGDSEYNLINLLKRIMKHDPTGNRRVKELYLFRHPKVDHQYLITDASSDLAKAFVHEMQLLRTFCIVMTLMGVLEAYLGIPMVPPIPIKIAGRIRHGEEAEARTAAERNALEEDKKSPFPVDQSQCEEMAASSYNACRKCYAKTNRKDLKRCGRCENVWYCSPKCQKKDWRDHKKFCGKTNFDPVPLEPAATDEFIGCPVVVSGFIRTPALWRQIWYLSKPDSQFTDYHFDAQPGHSDSVVIGYPPGARLIFLVARRRAMASGSLSAIYQMLSILEFEEDLGVRNFTHARYRRQLEKEYAIKITPAGRRAAGKFDPPTAQELKEEKQFLEQRWASVDNHPQRRPLPRTF
ncbi:hypothetical protein C8R45DRAFT_190981 [Mycena sanguinolenta]|nr:hypothetical protein C8R45DRAFT_190981 [Mycena sanguinolenta]